MRRPTSSAGTSASTRTRDSGSSVTVVFTLIAAAMAQREYREAVAVDRRPTASRAARRSRRAS